MVMSNFYNLQCVKRFRAVTCVTVAAGGLYVLEDKEYGHLLVIPDNKATQNREIWDLKGSWGLGEVWKLLV